MGEKASAISLANQFVDFYGKNGFLYGNNISDFLDSVRIDPSFLQSANKDGVCPSTKALFSEGVWQRGAANATELILSLWQHLQTPACYQGQQQSLDTGFLDALSDSHGHSHGEGPTAAQVWGLGLLFVTIINVCAAFGIVFLPFIGSKSYKLIMTFMIGLAVGTLAGSAILILLPEALQLEFFYEEINMANSSLIHHDHGHSHGNGHGHGHEHLSPFHGGAEAEWSDFLSAQPWYFWRGLAALGGIYAFFLLERMLREFTKMKMGGSNQIGAIEAGGHGHSHAVPVHAHNEVAIDQTKEAPSLVKVQPVAWMIIIGDAIHNFVDGLSIGAAFSQSTVGGISISIAIFCEELPHELGDFAILLAAGMTIKSALLFNLLSATSCYVGFALGVLLGEVPGVSVYIFAIACGMFLYISLVDMLPELNSMMDGDDAVEIGKGRLFTLQNLGLLSGVVIMILLALFSENIQVG